MKILIKIRKLRHLFYIKKFLMPKKVLRTSKEIIFMSYFSYLNPVENSAV